MIPIRVRLAIDYEYDNESNNIIAKKQKVVNRNRSLDTYFPPLLHTTTTTTTTNNNGGSNVPSTVSLVTDSSSMTVSDFTRYIVEEIYINNGEGHFIESSQRRCRDDQELEFVKILLQRLKSNGTNNTFIPNITTFRYGGRDARQITSRLLTEEKKGAITNCLIDFSLIDEQTEGYAITLAPTVNADKMFQTLLCCSSHQSLSSNNYVKRLELLLNAKVIIYRPTQSLELSTMTTSAAAASSSELQSVIESAKKSKRLSSQDILPKSLFNSIKDTARTKSTSTDKQTGSPHVLPALRTQLEQRDCNLVDKNEIVRNATNDNEQLIDKSTTAICGPGGSTTTKTKKRKVANDDASKRTKQSHHDDDDDDNNNNNDDALAIQSVVELIDGVPPILDQAWQDQFVNRKGLLESGHEQLIDSRNDTQESNTSCIAKNNLEVSLSLDESMSSNHSSMILLSQENENLDDKCSIDDDDGSASSSNDSSSNIGSSSSSSSSSDDSDEEDHHIVAPHNRASKTSQLNPDADEHCTKDTNTSETVDSSSPSLSRDSSSDSDEPSIHDDDGHGDDDNRDDVADKNILPTENLDDSVFEAAHANNADSIVKVDEFANQDELKNRDTSSVLNKNQSSNSRSDDDSSDSSSSSSSSSSSDESEDEGSIVEGTQILIEEVAKSIIKTQQAGQHNITRNVPKSRMIGRATPYHTSIDVSEQVFTQESEIVPTNLFGNRFGNNQQHKRGGEIESSTPPTDNAKIKGEDDKDESNSSTSDTSSSSDSSSDSDSESSNSSRNRKEGKGEVEDVVKPASIAPVPCSILPVVRPSRGRRRTPLVSMSRKIIITTTTGVPKTESFAR